MFFNFFFAAFWFLTLVLPVGDYHRYITSLTGARVIAADMYTEVAFVPQPLLFILPPPSPVPRYSPPAVTVQTPSVVKEPSPARFLRAKRVIALYKWVDTLFDYFNDLAGRPRLTRTINSPTPVSVPIYPAPPTTANQVHYDASAHIITSTFDLAGLWGTYKLVIGWIAVTLSAVMSTFIRFLSRSNADSHGLVGMADLALDQIPAASDSRVDTGFLSNLKTSSTGFDSILAARASLDSPSSSSKDVPLPAPTDNELTELADTSSSALASAASTRSAWIDTKTGVAGNTDTYGALVGGKTLEPAASHSSIGSISRYSRESSPDFTLASTTAATFASPDPAVWEISRDDAAIVGPSSTAGADFLAAGNHLPGKTFEPLLFPEVQVPQVPRCLIEPCIRPRELDSLASATPPSHRPVVGLRLLFPQGVVKGGVHTRVTEANSVETPLPTTPYIDQSDPYASYNKIVQLLGEMN